MVKMSTEQKAFLEEKFGNRLSWHKKERKLYGHDIAEMPSLFKPLIGNTIPAGVVQPESESELRELVQWAAKENVPLTPRGKATSGYGGAIPAQKGLVVDFYRMQRILSVDPAAQTATVEAGVVWERLDQKLAKHGLALRLYPTSYPSSTVGGWLAQGGAGIGSYQAGWFRDNVLSARVVLPTAEVREFTGYDLNFISDAEGITGFITQVTLQVQPPARYATCAVRQRCPSNLPG
ncbi:MAG: FAD-binding oxidoreductase [Pseudomonadota bacterium]